MEYGPANQRFALDEVMLVRIDAIFSSLPDDQTLTIIDKRIRRLVRDLYDDIGISINLDFYPRLTSPGELVTGQYLAVTVDGKPCRMNLNQQPDAKTPPIEIADKILGALVCNRTLLVSDNLVEAACRYLADEEPTDTPVAVVRSTLQDTVEQFFDFKTGLELCRVKLGKDEESEYEAELLMALRISKTIQLEVGRALYDAALKPAKDLDPDSEPLVENMTQMMRDGLYYELGIRLPPLELSLGETLDDNEFRIRINRLRGPILIGIDPGEALVNDTVDRLGLLNIKGDETINPANGSEAAIVPLEYAELCEQAGLTTWDPAGYMILSISASLRRYSSMFFTVAQVEYNLEQLDQAFPMLVFNVLERYSILTLTRVLRGLLAEEISIRDLRSILEALLELNGTTDVKSDRFIVFTAREAHLAASTGSTKALKSDEIIDFVRGTMRRYISHKYTRGGSTLVVYLLAPGIEERIREPSALDMTERKRLIEAFWSEIGNRALTSQIPVILTTQDIRARLRRELESEFPNLAIISYQELDPVMNIQPIARIDWPETAAPH